MGIEKKGMLVLDAFRKCSLKEMQHKKFLSGKDREQIDSSLVFVWFWGRDKVGMAHTHTHYGDGGMLEDGKTKKAIFCLYKWR